MNGYYARIIDRYLTEWKDDKHHKPLLLRGARQVGKSSAARHLGKQFKYFAEINFEKQKDAKVFFKGDIDAKLIAAKISNYIGVPVEAGSTLLFLDEIQEYKEALMALRFFKEDFPELHVIAAGSLLEFSLNDLPTFGVGRIHSLFMYPLTFSEFLDATGNKGLTAMLKDCDYAHPLDDAFHSKLIELFRIYLMVGGMPEAVTEWVKTGDFLRCQAVHHDIVLTYEDDFGKYSKKVSPELMRMVMRGVCHQIGQKLTFTEITRDYRSVQLRQVLRLLTQAGLVTPVVSTSANGLPLDAGSDENVSKYLFIDPGLLLSVLQLDGASSKQLVELIMTGTPADLVNKGAITEMVAGLELMRYREPIQRQKMFYWQKGGKSSAEIDYLVPNDLKILPIEVKSGTQGGMKSLWTFMREKHLHDAIRCSLENFGEFDYTDSLDGNSTRHVSILPLYAINKMVEAR